MFANMEAMYCQQNHNPLPHHMHQQLNHNYMNMMHPGGPMPPQVRVRVCARERMRPHLLCLFHLTFRRI